MLSETDFESLVQQYYQSLYRFAFSLTRSEADASDLTQQTFYIWAAKGSQLREPGKVKSWLFTTLHREFLNSRRRIVRFPHMNLEENEAELPAVGSPTGARLDVRTVLDVLADLDEAFQAPLALFYLEDCAYREIAEILGIPLGTVKSRLARGIEQLQRRLTPVSAPETLGRKATP